MTISEKIARAKTDIDEVYSAGYTKGKAEGGGGSGYDENHYWDILTKKGALKRYQYFFAGSAITKEYIEEFVAYLDRRNITTISFAETKITDEYCSNMFAKAAWRRSSSEPLAETIDLSALCARMDFSGCLGASATFGNANVMNITADFSNCEQLYQTFSNSDNSNSKYLDNVNIKVSAKCTYSGTFAYCGSLTKLIFMEGSVIGQNGLDLQRSTLLSKASFESVVGALSTETSGLSITVSKTAVNKAFETSAGANDGSTSAEWENLIAPKTNWTINLA